MAKKRKSKDSTKGGGGASASINEEKVEEQMKNQMQQQQNDDDSDSSSSDDDSLVLEGVLIRNPDASDSDSDEMSSEEEEDEPTKKKAKKGNLKSDGASAKSKGKSNNSNINNGKKSKPKQQSKKKKQSNEPETIQVEFLFCDLHERFFHGMKTLLHRNNVHAPHSSQLADLIIENEMVGTVLSSDIEEMSKKPAGKSDKGDKSSAALPMQDEPNVFGFASIINLTTNHKSPTIQSLKSLCLKHCPAQHKVEMETVLSGKTKRPAGFFFHERMVNVPLEITEVLHQQLVLDMDHAVETADDEAERKSLDFGAFVRLAPCYKSEGGTGVIYKYFDDEVFATNAEFVYNFEAPKNKHEGEDDDDEAMWCSVIVLTKTGHRDAMKELKKMIHG